MTTRDTPFPPGTPCWAEYRCPDPDAAKQFYAALFGWETEEVDGYTNFVYQERRVAGLVTDTGITEARVATIDSQAGAGDDAEAPIALSSEPCRATWRVYVATADVDESLKLVSEAGGTVISGAERSEGIATTAVIDDAVGARLGLWQPDGHFGFRRYAEVGSLLWSEHQSTDYQRSTAFYGAVFNWKPYSMSDTEEYRYAQALLNGQIVAGLLDAGTFLPDGAASYWAAYFSVTDTDAVLARALELGAGVVRPVEETPFGRIADIADPAGVPVKIHQAPQPVMPFKL